MGKKTGIENEKKNNFFVTAHIKNFENAGLTPEQYNDHGYLANFFANLWNASGKDRTCGVSVCMSKDGCYHLHMGLHAKNNTTIANVAKLLFNSHVEFQKGGQASLLAYLKKEPPYDEKGEIVLYTLGLENFQGKKSAGQGHRSDLSDIQDMLDRGMSPDAIMLEGGIKYTMFKKHIINYYTMKRKKETALIKEITVEYHVGKSGTGKTNVYVELCGKEDSPYSPDDIYLTNDFLNGGFDMYLEQGAPPVLFLDEFKGVNMPYAVLLGILDKYSRLQVHCRYHNALCLWNRVVITSVYPPEEIYEIMTDKMHQKSDTFEQLRRRLTKIVYHYKENDEYKTYSISGKDYIDYADLKAMAHGNNNGFSDINKEDAIPFDSDSDKPADADDTDSPFIEAELPEQLDLPL